MAPGSDDLTQLLEAWSSGDDNALEQLTHRVYKELHRVARRHMARERPDHSLQTTALINEVYIRLIGGKSVRWQNRAHFFAVSAHLMRRILVDFARAHRQAKRGGGVNETTLDEACVFRIDRTRDLVALDEALQSLAEIDPRKSNIVELRFFGGLSVAEIAVVLNVSERTILREWNVAKAWLHREISGAEVHGA
jgi:RNA polymerase sigma-70 factor (ECF subfamily)